MEQLPAAKQEENGMNEKAPHVCCCLSPTVPSFLQEASRHEVRCCTAAVSMPFRRVEQQPQGGHLCVPYLAARKRYLTSCRSVALICGTAPARSIHIYMRLNVEHVFYTRQILFATRWCLVEPRTAIISYMPCDRR